jgi:hypothetical protein
VAAPSSTGSPASEDVVLVEVVDHYVNYARTEQALFDRSSLTRSASATTSAGSVPHE